MPNVLVREEQTVLGDIPDMALRWLDKYPSATIQPRFFPQRNNASCLAPDATDRFQQTGFARSRDTENPGHVFFGMQIYIQLKTVQREADLHSQSIQRTVL